MIVTDEQVQNHLRIDPGEDVSVYVSAAQAAAKQFLNRNIYEDQAALTAAQSGSATALEAAVAVYDAAIAAAALLDDSALKDAQIFAAEQRMSDAVYESKCVAIGMVADDLIRSAVLLMTGHLYANREDVVVGASVAELPMSSLYLLQPHRRQMGV